ncbi:5167_t:CDS:2 [Entrophospora sp. SA101]|nr:5167_t:CDS:2 [Entrophospora sp. SA101]
MKCTIPESVPATLIKITERILETRDEIWSNPAFMTSMSRSEQSASCRSVSNQFGIAGIQIAGTDMRLNVLVKDLAGLPRYFHFDNSEIPLSPPYVAYQISINFEKHYDRKQKLISTGIRTS